MGRFEQDWRERFERFAKSYNADHLISGWSSNGLRRRLALFEEVLSNQDLGASSQILDLGCGGGTYVRFLDGLGHQVIGLDYSLPSLRRALAADQKRKGSYIGGEAYSLPFCEECFDVVVSIGVLQALDDPARALDEMVRVLRPSGYLIVEFLNAFELIALSKSAIERITRKLPRVHTYSPYQVEDWLAKRSLKPFLRKGVYLHPRSLPSLGRILNHKRVIQLLENIPGLSLISSHAFILFGQKVFPSSK